MALLSEILKPRSEDVVTAVVGLEAVAADVAATLASYEARLQVLEQFMADHKAGASNRQREIDRLNLENAQLRRQIGSVRR